jgi:tRNA/tmRNA/rRNA uracil-C5-methylase (TrmA/RlmC/RlmD family)
MESERGRAKMKSFKVGEQFSATIEKIAHGGHFIVRHEGAVFFIRHGIPGEEVLVEVTSTGKSFNRGDVVEVLTPSPDRVTPPCKYAHRLGCGGCDFQHITPTRVRSLKSEVITEQFKRIAKEDLIVEVEEIGEALNWRSRAILNVDQNGKAGFYAARSHKLIPIADCLICVPQMKLAELLSESWQPDSKVEISTNRAGQRIVANLGEAMGPEYLIENVKGVDLQVSGSSFWQSHISAPEVLSEAVMNFAQLEIGDHVLDLYGGVGLFTAAAILIIGDSGQVDLVEGSSSAISDAKANFADNGNVNIYLGDVASILPRIGAADVVILDPPRDGAGLVILEQVDKLNPKRIVYVACDPAALARDTAIARQLGWDLSEVRAFDLFPMTHHIEMVALFTRSTID